MSQNPNQQNQTHPWYHAQAPTKTNPHPQPEAGYPESRFSHSTRPAAGEADSYRAEHYPSPKWSYTSARQYNTHFPDRTKSSEYVNSPNRKPPKQDRLDGWSNTGGGPYGRVEPYNKEVRPRRW